MVVDFVKAASGVKVLGEGGGLEGTFKVTSIG